MNNNNIIDLNSIEFVNEQVIEINYDTFMIYKVIGTNEWFAQHYDQEVCADDIIVGDNIISDGGMVFGVYISKEDFQKFNGLRYE